MSEPVIHRILCRDVTAVRERIERVLGVKTSARPSGFGDGRWAIDFTVSGDVNLDFLRPDVLPPKDDAAA